MTYTPTPVMLLGTFHFADRGLDAYKPKTTFDVRVRQGEVQEVVTCLKAFEPTKVAVELRAEEQGAMNRDYRAYRRGDLKLGPDEVHQLGFQLVKELGHGGLYGVNAWDRYYDPPLDFEKIAQGRSAIELNAYLAEHYPDFNPYEDLAAYAEKHGQSHLLTEWDRHYYSDYDEGDRERLEQPLREILRQTNREENILEGHGTYMVGPIKIGVGNEYPGADLTIKWYTRNLRIFANLQRITEAEDHIVIIYELGHTSLLRHCREASP